MASDIVTREALLLNLQDYEGPLDLLLDLARDKKFDLTKISIAELARQYLHFIETAQKLKIELAADYLYMATYLAWLKSRLLVPSDEDDSEEDIPPERQAEMLRQRLLHLEQMKQRAAQLMARHRLGQDIFAYAQASGIAVEEKSVYDTKLFELLQSYARIVSRNETGTLEIAPTRLFTPDQMRQRLRLMLGAMADWVRIDSLVPDEESSSPRAIVKRSAFAGLLVGGLALVKEGVIDMRQTEPFAPVYIKKT